MKSPMCMEMLPIETKTLKSIKAFFVGQSFVQKSNYNFYSSPDILYNITIEIYSTIW